MKHDQPSEKLENENAAYVWAKECRRNLLKEMSRELDLTDEGPWDDLCWLFERVRVARQRYVDAVAARVASGER